jgi:hypothetical protein
MNEHTPAHGMVFAQAYSAFLEYYDANNVAAGDWKPFFSGDISIRLAIAAVQDVEYYKANIATYFGFLNNSENKNKEPELKNNLGYLFSYMGTLARQLDVLKDGLPPEISLKGVLQNRIRSHLAPAFNRLIAYYKADLAATAPHPLVADAHPGIVILGATTVVFSEIYNNGLSRDWITDSSADWNIYITGMPADISAYGSGVTVFERINHIATHTLFTSIFDQFLKGYARTVNDAKLALETTFTNWDWHEPHYALFLAYLRLFEYARAEANTLTGRHLDFYYREILRLKEKAPKPGNAHLLVELAKQTPTHLVEAGELFKAGKDDLGREAFFANDRDFIASQAKVAALKTVYRHGDEKVGTPTPTGVHSGRLYASPVANSDDGLGTELTSVDQSWHPFYNKLYEDGVLSEIGMPKAEEGFAIASHYLWMAGGRRLILAEIEVTGYSAAPFEDFRHKITCQITSEKGWIEKDPFWFFPISVNTFWLMIEMAGSDASITSYLAKTHGYTFDTDLPVLLVKLKHDATDEYAYPIFEDIVVKSIKLHVFVFNLRTLAVSNDFGPVDTSKPFQPYGASPVANSALVIGSREIFQKKLDSVSIGVTWLIPPLPYPYASPPAVNVNIDFLKDGQWLASNADPITVSETVYNLTGNLDYTVVDEPDIVPNEFYSMASRRGFVRLRLNRNFGQDAYQADLLKYQTTLAKYQADLLKYVNKTEGATEPGNPPSGPPAGPPIGPSMVELWMNYAASQAIILDSATADTFNGRNAQFFHLAPFGQAEQHPYLKTDISDKAVYLLPQLKHLNTADDKFPTGHPVKHEAEFYIGITGLNPPQNLALYFQVADGTADPLAQKPKPHIHWSYLRSNEWIPFDQSEVEDLTRELLNSGIVTFAMPRDASDADTLLPAGMHWIRAAVASESDAVCRLILAAAQALEATFTERGNDPAFPGKVLVAGTISKLDQPNAAVKKIIQPFPTFGGRGAELPTAFYTRISERLRHKDRAIALWDYERLILEAFPQIYKAKCLNHTHYEPSESGIGIYKELAPGHVTVVTVPNQQSSSLRDPLRPYTSLGLLQEIDAFLRKRLSCFVKLHVRNPQFEEVWVDSKVRFYEGLDANFYKNKLQDDITRFLSPWAFPGGGSPSFGGKIYKSVLVNFVEELPYVDYVTDFKLFHNVEGVQGTSDKNEVEGSKAVSILVSIPAKEHKFTPIRPAEEETPGEKCPCEA